MSRAEDCLQEIGSGEWANRLAERSEPPHDFPLAGSVELTLRCNLRCRHCYAVCPGLADGELPTDLWKRLFDQLAARGVLWLALTGGEVFLRQDFRELYLHVRRAGLLPILLTNATLVDSALADFLAEHPPRRIEATAYGHTPATYERIAGVPGSFRQFRLGVERLLERRLPLHLKMMVLRSNVHEFEAVRQWAEALGRPFRYDAVVQPRLDGDRAPTAERLPADDVARLRFGNGRGSDAVLPDRAPSGPARLPTPLFQCGAGTRTFHVDRRGRMHPCLMWRSDPFDPFAHSLDEDWRRHIRGLRALPRSAASVCAGCPDAPRCPICPALALLETGSPDEPAPYYCAIARAGEKRLDMA